MSEFDNLVRTINPYSMAFEMMHEIKKEEYKKAEKCGLIPKEVKMYMVGNSTLDKKNNGAVVYNEVAILHVGEDGLSQNERDICIYSISSDACRIHIISQHIDPMIYRLLFPCDECGSHPNFTCLKKMSNKINLLPYNIIITIYVLERILIHSRKYQ